MIKKVLLKIFREGIGGLMALVSYLTTPSKVKRSSEEQEKVNTEVQKLSLYQYFTCPFCIKVRRHIRRLNLPMEYRDAQVRGGEHRNTLEQEGGAAKVPCLRIEADGKVIWMYESNDIIAYLNKHFDPTFKPNS
ncbi:MAG: glutathione S-transferase N-terminal domain-containing protein [Ghiorsea sp.]|nr:glutathione S-transferase N-terminal domain-containing protein [Ghiorsea sp.]